MAALSADDHLTVGGDANVVVGADPEHAVGSRPHVPARWLLDGGTQWMPLSAAIKQRLVCGSQRGPRALQHRSAYVDDKLCLRASGAEVGRPAHRATELVRR